MTNTPSADVLTIEATTDGSMTCRSQRYKQTFHSTFGAIAEARQVYLEHSGVAERLRSGLPTRVLEVGFGLGLNTLLTVDLARQTSTPLTYIAYDRVLHDPATLAQLDYQRWLTNPTTASHLYAAMKNWGGNAPKLWQLAWQESIDLHLHIVEITEAQLDSPPVDAIYLDAFSPDQNPECWTPDFLGRLTDALTPGGVLATYCVQGHVRRALKHHGLQLSKHPGPPGKREILSAIKSV